MINGLFGFLNLYLGAPIAEALQNFAIEADNYYIGGGYSEELVLFAYTMLMGALLVLLICAGMCGIVYIIQLVWKGIKSLL